MPISRRGVLLNNAKLSHELARRGATARQLAERSGVPEATLSRARYGRPISPATLRRLTEGLLAIPLMVGADLLISQDQEAPAA
jgi:transcriptional regulator with XRE-family HTH domain